MSRPLVATIRLDHLRHNYLEAKRLSGTRALAAVKANAYGHGAVRCAQALQDIADGFGVRAAGPTFEHRIAYIAWLCVLEGPWLLVLAIALRPQTVWSHLKRTWWRGVIGGTIANVGYGIAIYALVLGPMAHVAALRETSVLFGALMGTLLLGEPFGLRRVAAAFVIVSGLVMMNGPRFI